MYSCMHGQAPQYLMDCCPPTSSVASRQQLRSASWRLLVVPRFQLSATARRAFAVSGILCRTTCAILLLAETHLDNIWKRFLSAHCSAPFHPISARSAPFLAPLTCSACVYNYELYWFYVNHLCIFLTFLNILISVIILCLSFVANKRVDKSTLTLTLTLTFKPVAFSLLCTQKGLLS